MERRRRGCWTRLALWVVLPGLFLLGLIALSTVLYLQTEDFQRRVGQAATIAVYSATGERLELGRVQIRYLPPAVEVHDLRLIHPATDEPILQVPYAKVPLSTSGAGDVVVHHPSLLLHLDADGLREFRSVVTGNNPLKRLPLDSLRLEGLDVQLATPKGRVSLSGTLRPVAGTLHHLGGTLRVQHEDLDSSLPLDLHGVRIGPTLFELPNVHLHNDILTLDGWTRVPFDGIPLGAAHLSLNLDATTGVLPEPRALHGTITTHLITHGPTSATVDLEGLGVDVPGLGVPVLSYTFGDAHVEASTHDGLIDIDSLGWQWGTGRFDAVARIDPVKKELVEAQVYGDAVYLREILMAMDVAPHPWIDFEGFVEAEGSGSLQPVAIHGDFALWTQNLRVTNGPVHLDSSTSMLDIPQARARGTLFLEQDHVELTAPWVGGPVTRASAIVDIGFGPKGPLDARIDAHHAHLADFQPLAGIEIAGTGPISGRIWGPFDKLQFEGRGDLQDFSALGLPFADHLVAGVIRSPDMQTLEIAEATATVGTSVYTGDFGIDFRAPLSMHADLTLQHARIEDISGIFVQLDGIDGNLSGHLGFDGPLQAMNADARFDLADVGLWGERFPDGLAVARMRDGLFVLEQGHLERQNGTESLDLTGTVQGAWELDMQLDTHGFRIERLHHMRDSGVDIRGDLDLSTRFDSTLFVPDPQGSLTATDVSVAGRALPDSRATFTSSGGRLSLDAMAFGEAIHATGTVPLFEDLPYLLHAHLDEVPLHLMWPEAVDGTPIRAVASGEVQIAGKVDEGWPPRSLFADLDPVEASWSHHHLTNDGPWALRLDDDVLTLERFALKGGGTDLEVTGTIDDAVHLDGVGHLDLDLLRAVTPGLQRAEGTAELKLRTASTDGRLRTRVDVDVDASLLRHETVPAAIEDSTAKIVLTDELFTLSSFRGGIGGGTIKGSGTVRAQGWTPVRYDLRTQISDAQVQWVESLPEAVGNAALVFDGPSEALLLSGEVEVTEMVFADRLDWEDWVIEYREDVVVDAAQVVKDDALFDLDVHILADDTVRLQNNLVEGIGRADLRLIGDTARTGMLGEIRVDNALVFLQDREFRVDRGAITYRDPWTWNPDVDFELLTDVRSRDQRYRIAYQIYGPFSDWRTSSRSEPDLPQSDVNALLWFGVTAEDLQQAGDLPTAVAQGVADLLLTDLFASTQASELGEVPDLLFDSIDVATGVNGRGEYSAEPRLVVRKRLEDLGDVELMWEFNLGRPEDNYLRIDKRIGEVWNIAGWYATLQRDRVLPIGGAYGVDLAARWEIE